MEPNQINVFVELGPNTSLTFIAGLRETQEDYEVLFPRKVWRLLETYKRGSITKLKMAVLQ